MEIKYTVDATNALTDLVLFIEEKNTKVAGLRWLNKFETYLQDALQYLQVIMICNNLTFKSWN